MSASNNEPSVLEGSIGCFRDIAGARLAAELKAESGPLHLEHLRIRLPAGAGKDATAEAIANALAAELRSNKKR